MTRASWLSSQQDRRQHESGDTDRHVDEEDPLPAEGVGQDSPEQYAGHGAEAADRTPGAEGDVALTAFAERRGEDRQCGRGDDRRAEALEGAGADQRRLRPGQPRQQRGHGEHDDADEEDAAAAQHVGGPAAEQQEPAEDQGVGADHPLEVLLREPEVALDGGQSDVHDRDVEDDHELDDAQEREGQPLRRSDDTGKVACFSEVMLATVTASTFYFASIFF